MKIPVSVAATRIMCRVESECHLPFLSFLLLYLIKFHPSSSGYCIARDSFCDGVNDCPGGEDEHFCYGIQYQNNGARNANGFGEVMQQTFGLWHSKCYNKTTPPNREEMLQLCQTLGYKERTRVDVRILKEDEEDPDRSKPMKPVINSVYSDISLNKNLRFLLKPSQPVAKLVHWDSSDKSKCKRLEIRCSSD